jgi:hypothetical protein
VGAEKNKISTSRLCVNIWAISCASNAREKRYGRALGSAKVTDDLVCFPSILFIYLSFSLAVVLLPPPSLFAFVIPHREKY